MIVVTDGLDYNHSKLIWTKLDQAHQKHLDMVLVCGKLPKGIITKSRSANRPSFARAEKG